MKKLLAPLLLLLLPLPALAGPYDGIVVFGDSLSDTHNEFDAYGTPTAPYFNGRYSNGPLWVEDLAPQLGLTYNPATNYAVAGATTGTANADSLPGHAPLAGMQTQVAAYLTAHPLADPNSLYVLWGGADDYGYDLRNGILPDATTAAAVVGNLAGEASLLAAHGARKFLIPNLGDLGALPYTQLLGPGIPALATALTALHNADLAFALGSLRSTFATDTFFSLDINAKFAQIVTDPAAYGFADVTDGYLQYAALHPGTTADPNSFLFYDLLHPTAAGHLQIANAAYSAVVPEPGLVGLLIGMGASGAAFGLRRRRK